MHHTLALRLPTLLMLLMPYTLGASGQVHHKEKFTKGPADKPAVVCHLTYTITPAGHPQGDKKGPILIERHYSAPQERHDRILLRPLKEADIASFQALAKASKAHTDTFESAFYKNNTRSINIQARSKQRMAIFYQQEKAQDWQCIGETGFNRHPHNGHQNEVFIWRGDLAYLEGAQVGIPSGYLKGVMRAAAKGFVIHAFKKDPALPYLLSYTDKDNIPTQQLQVSIGFQETKDIEQYTLYNKKSHYKIYRLDRSKYAEILREDTMEQR